MSLNKRITPRRREPSTRELVDEAVAAFARLSPDEQRAHRRAQREARTAARKAQRHAILPTLREPSGRPARTESAAERERKAEKAKGVVLAQPHRKGSTDQRRIWPIGRMILDGKVKASGIEPGTLELAAQRYSQQYAMLRWTMDARRPYENSAGGNRREPTPEERRDIERAWSDTRRALRDCPGGARVASAMDMAILDAHPDFDERSFNSFIPGSCSEGLAALVRHWGMAT